MIGTGKGKFNKILIIVPILLCVLCTAPLCLDTFITFSRNLFAPQTKQFDSPQPHLLQEFPNGVYKLHWEEDASHITINIGNSTSFNPDTPDTIADFNLETGETIFYEETNPNDQSLQPEVISQLGINTESEYWALCPEKNLVVAAGGFEDEQYWLKYWKNYELVNTFFFSSQQWPADYPTPDVSLEFSPSCRKASLILSGWIYYEGDGREELWLLDTSSQTLERLIKGKKPVFALWDYPVQQVTPGWSPDEDKFVFGGWTFGLEVYDIAKSKQRRLTGPHHNLHSAKWSSSGKWIAAIQSGSELDRVYIFLPDGSLHSSTDGCYLITDYRWAPKEDKIAFVCHDECNNLCAETRDNPCQSACSISDYLWLWDLE